VRARWQEPVVVGTAWILLAACALLPLVYLAGEAARAGDTGVLAEAATWRRFGHTAAVAGAVAALALAIGVPLGFLLGRSDVRGRAAVLVLHAFPIFLPPFLLALGWTHVWGAQGWLGSPATARWLYGTGGAIAVTALALAPVVTVLTALGLDAIDPAIEEAGRTAARPRQVAARILWPLVWPSAALGALLVFALAFGELGVPMLLRAPSYTASVFARLGGIDYQPGEAFQLVLPLLGLAALLVAIERRLRRGRALAALGLRRDRPPLPLGRWRWPATLLCWAVAALGLAPRWPASPPAAAASPRPGPGWATASPTAWSAPAPRPPWSWCSAWCSATRSPAAASPAASPIWPPSWSSPRRRRRSASA
jgi:iron(III) transport system permease protein